MADRQRVFRTVRVADSADRQLRSACKPGQRCAKCSELIRAILAIDNRPATLTGERLETFKYDELEDFYDRQAGRRAYLTETDYYDDFDCSSPMCYGGGIDLGIIVRSMSRIGETDRTTVQKCRGYEGSPKGRRRKGICARSFSVEIHIVYHPGDTST